MVKNRKNGWRKLKTNPTPEKANCFFQSGVVIVLIQCTITVFRPWFDAQNLDFDPNCIWMHLGTFGTNACNGSLLRYKSACHKQTSIASSIMKSASGQSRKLTSTNLRDLVILFCYVNLFSYCTKFVFFNVQVGSLLKIWSKWIQGKRNIIATRVGRNIFTVLVLLSTRNFIVIRNHSSDVRSVCVIFENFGNLDAMNLNAENDSKSQHR